MSTAGQASGASGDSSKVLEKHELISVHASVLWSVLVRMVSFKGIMDGQRLPGQGMDRILERSVTWGYQKGHETLRRFQPAFRLDQPMTSSKCSRICYIAEHICH